MKLYEVSLSPGTQRGIYFGSEKGYGLTGLPLPAGYDGFRVYGNGARLEADWTVGTWKADASLMATGGLHLELWDVSVGAGSRSCVFLDGVSIAWHGVRLEDDRPVKWGSSENMVSGRDSDTLIDIPGSSEHARYRRGFSGDRESFRTRVNACGGEGDKITWRPDVAAYKGAVEPRKHALDGHPYVPGVSVRLVDCAYRGYGQRTQNGSSVTSQGQGYETSLVVERGSSYSAGKGTIMVSDGDGQAEFYGSGWKTSDDPATGLGVGFVLVQDHVMVGGRGPNDVFARCLDSRGVRFEGCAFYGEGKIGLKGNAAVELVGCNTDAIRQAVEGLGWSTAMEPYFAGTLIGVPSDYLFAPSVT